MLIVQKVTDDVNSIKSNFCDYGSCIGFYGPCDYCWIFRLGHDRFQILFKSSVIVSSDSVQFGTVNASLNTHRKLLATVTTGSF
jgi:hypothetical protein